MGLGFGLVNDLAVHFGWEAKHEAWIAVDSILALLSQPTFSVAIYVLDSLDLQNALMQNVQSATHSSPGVADWLYVTAWGLFQWGFLVPILVAGWVRMREGKRTAT